VDGAWSQCRIAGLFDDHRNAADGMESIDQLLCLLWELWRGQPCPFDQGRERSRWDRTTGSGTHTTHASILATTVITQDRH
jgi:hypothetical protein